MADDLRMLVFRWIEEYSAGRHNKRYGLVTSWDPKTHLAKVAIQPEGTETGWLPTHTMAAANGVGLMTGLTPGDGKTTGDQVEVTYDQGDFESGAITSRVHSDTDVPPAVESGEQLLKTPFNSLVKLAKDGSITVTDKHGVTLKLDGSGGVTLTGATTITITASGKIAINGSPVDING